MIHTSFEDGYTVLVAVNRRMIWCTSKADYREDIDSCDLLKFSFFCTHAILKATVVHDSTDRCYRLPALKKPILP